jgi:hypothetical protein
MFNKTFYIKTNYLLDCDYINKYSLKTLFKKPSFKSISIYYSLNNIIAAFANKNLTEEDQEIQIKSNLLLYFFSMNVPFITSNNVKMLKNSNGNSYYSLKIKLSNEKDITNFLFSLLLENKNNVSNILKVVKNIKIPNANAFTVPVFANQLLDLNNLLDYSITNINSKEFLINISFTISVLQCNLNSRKYMQNLSMFWLTNIK